MPHLKKLLAALGVAAVAAAPAGAHMLRRNSTRKPVIHKCVKGTVAAPKTYTLACGDGYTGLQDLRWADWGAKTASAVGKGFANTCTPSCVAGKIVTNPVTLTVSGLSGGQYQRIVVTARGKHPKLVAHVSTYQLRADGPYLVIH